MSAEQLEGIIRAQRRLLWMLPKDERERRLGEVRADYVFEEQLAAVAGEMASEGEDQCVTTA